MEDTMLRGCKVVVSESGTVYMTKPVKDISVSIGDMHYEDKSKFNFFTFYYFGFLPFRIWNSGCVLLNNVVSKRGNLRGGGG